MRKGILLPIKGKWKKGRIELFERDAVYSKSPANFRSPSFANPHSTPLFIKEGLGEIS